METIISNPGLHHLVEKVFWNLDGEDLRICAQINQSSKQILQHPIFFLRKFRGLSKKNRENWIKVIQSVKTSDEGIAIMSYLQWNLKKEVFVDLPCYSSPAVQDDFRKRIWEICEKISRSTYEKFKKIYADRQDLILSHEDIEVVKILAPLTDNLNAPDEHGKTPIYLAAYNGHIEIVKFLAPLTDNPNAPVRSGNTPILEAAHYGHTEIVKILAPLAGNPNALGGHGMTPIIWAAYMGHTEIVKILASFIDNPNAPGEDGRTPIYLAAWGGHTEIVQFLAPLTDNPNTPAPGQNTTPIFWAACYGYTEIVKILAPLTDNPNAPDKDGNTPLYWAEKIGNWGIVKILKSFKKI